jgi:small subunit ribosomal protein S9
MSEKESKKLNTGSIATKKSQTKDTKKNDESVKNSSVKVSTNSSVAIKSNVVPSLKNSDSSADTEPKIVVVQKKQTSTKSSNLGNRKYGTGRRKNAIARVWIMPGKGLVSINGKDSTKYFPREFHVKSIIQPFVVTNTLGQYDVICTVKGGGLSGQAGAILHGVSRALDQMVPDFHTILRKAGMLTRDPRVVERKKYGQHKARKSTQFSKR